MLQIYKKKSKLYPNSERKVPNGSQRSTERRIWITGVMPKGRDLTYYNFIM